MNTVIKKGSRPEVVLKTLNKVSGNGKKSKDKNKILKLCGSITLREDPADLQKRLRDEWQ